jgi:predicted nucleic acid-binding protein
VDAFFNEQLDTDILKDAFDLCKRTNRFKSFNDAVHLKFAEKYCDKLITFDSDFAKFRSHTDLDIVIL